MSILDLTNTPNTCYMGERGYMEQGEYTGTGRIHRHRENTQGEYTGTDRIHRNRENTQAQIEDTGTGRIHRHR